MKRTKKFFKRFGTDIAGFTCLILVIPVGALPGPGGIPLLIAGLGLLSIHNKWARSLLEYVKKHSSSLRAIFFPKNKKIELAWDVTALSLFITAIYLSVSFDHWLIRGLGTGLAAGSSTLFMFNRSRIERIRQIARKR